MLVDEGMGHGDMVASSQGFVELVVLCYFLLQNLKSLRLYSFDMTLPALILLK
jgi:hypothetical protein